MPQSQKALIKAIFFDFDGVLTTDKYGSTSTFHFLAKSTGISEILLSEAFAPHMANLIFGRKSHADVLPAISASLGYPIEATRIFDAFDSTPINHPVLDLARNLKSSYAVGIITDNSSDRMERLVDLHSFKSIFDPIVVSADYHSSKHMPDLFIRALELAGIKPQESIFIDNTEKNLVIAKEAGMHVIHHDDEINDVARLRAILSSQYGISLAGVT